MRLIKDFCILRRLAFSNKLDQDSCFFTIVSLECLAFTGLPSIDTVDFGPELCHTVFTLQKLERDRSGSHTGWRFFVAPPHKLFLSRAEPFRPAAASFSLMINAMAGHWELGDLSCLSRDDREEALWIARARAGDEAAYRWLLGRYRARVVRLAAHVLHGDGDAEDLAQEAFVRAFQRLGSFRGRGRFSAWLFSLTVRLCLDRRRSARFRREVPADAAPNAVSNAVSPDASPDTRLLIDALLDRLTPPLRAALVLRELEGFEYDEIAEMLQIPVGTVRSRLHAARARFRELWTAAQTEADSHV